MTQFVDSSAFYAGADPWRSPARAGGRDPRRRGALVPTDHVLVEVWLLLQRRLGPGAAERFWEGLRSGAARIEPVGAADMERAWGIGTDIGDQALSSVDRTSFAVMLRFGVLRASTTTSPSFASVPRERALEIIR